MINSASLDKLKRSELVNEVLSISRKIKIKGGGEALQVETRLSFVVVHTKSNAPDPIRTPKLSDFRHG